MYRTLLVFSLLASAIVAPSGAVAQEFRPETIIALERAALDRWIKGDPEGYLEIYAADVTYFDPSTESRVDGLDALRARFAAIKGRVGLSRYELLNPSVYRKGDTAVLTYNIVTYGARQGGEPVVTRWNTTEVYALLDGRWRIVHGHFSLTTPQPPAAKPQ